MKRLATVLALFVLCSMAMTAKAQLAVYGMGSGGFLSSVNANHGATTLFSDSFSAYGGTFGVYDDFKHFGPVALGSDGRFFVQSSGNGNQYGNQLLGGLAGARVALFSHFVPFSPYLQAEIGGVGTNYGVQAQKTLTFSYQIQGGLDYTLFPHLDARIEYGAGQIGALFPGTRQEMQQIGLGLVVRFF